MMDFGDDPLINTQYESIHLRAVESLKPCSKFSLAGLNQRHEWLKMSLPELKDLLVTPEMMVAANMKWNKLASKYGISNLIQFGFRWPSMLAAGFEGKHLRCLTACQMEQLGINAARALECRPHATDVRALNLSATELQQQGWTIEMLQSIGLSMQNMVDFGFSLNSWKTHFNISNFESLGFTNRALCEQAGWRAYDIALAFQKPQQTDKSVATLKAANPHAAFTIQL